MMILKPLALTLVLSAIACASHADDPRPSLFNCVFKPGGSTEIRKTYSVPRGLRKNFTRIPEQMDDVKFEILTARGTVHDNIGRHQAPPKLTIARVECKW